MKDYKETLLMPKTNFEMRGNLSVKEPLIQEKWNRIDLYNKVNLKNQNKPQFVLHDGPPYANGDIHMGHFMNKTLKDFVVRYKNMNGFSSKYVPGFDTHGLPIETAITKSGVNRKEKTVLEFRKLCHEYALKQVAKQTEQFKRIGVLGQWDDPYVTLKKEFESEQIEVFSKMVEKGLIYKGLKPIFWSPTSESALAEAEIEYQDKVDSSIYVKMDVVNGTGNYENSSLVIWTTTPWTIPANLAISVGEQVQYVLVNSNKGKLIFAKDLQDKLCELLELKNVVILETEKGKNLTHLKYKHPLYERISPVVIGHHVTTTDGTGLVHTAPGHGEDDFIIGKNNGLEIYCPVDDKGIMMESSGKYAGLFYEKCNKTVIEDLQEMGYLLKLLTINHSYPHDWRTKKPVIFRATPQWFASIEDLKEELLNAIKDVKWYPKWGEVRMSNMIQDRKEWCISRQRVWGVPIPAFYAEDKTEILEPGILQHISKLFKEHGSDIWFSWEAKDLLPEGYKNEHSPNGIFTKETDTMDVWFDSGSSHQILKTYGIKYPADLYLEGNDQYRGWFNSSLITGVSLTNMAPYKETLTHGMILDGQGKKMSKSLGNAVDPVKEMNQKGADILRLWVSSVEYTSDVKISPEMIKQVSEIYRKIRNTFKFLLGNIYDFDYKTDEISFDKLSNCNKYMLLQLNNLTKNVLNAYECYRFDEVNRLIMNYITNILSSFYLDFTKDILYIEKKDSFIRRSVQTVLYHHIKDLTKLLTPIIPHTCSEAYDELKEDEDVYLTDMPEVKDYSKYAELENNFEQFFNFRDAVLKELENARNEKIIGKSLNAHLIVYPTQKIKQMISYLNEDFAQLLIVSKFELKDVNDELKIEVKEKTGCTCSRCWQVVDSLNENELCERCQKVINEL